MSKASKGRTWLQNVFVDMRTVDIAYHHTLESLAFALSNEKVAWLLSPVAGWSVVLNTPVECGVHPISGEIVGRHQLWNCAEKTRWMADPEVYGHIQTKAYVEHPYEKQYTKDFIKQGVLAACLRGMSARSIAVQVAEIIDARLDCVLLPSDPVANKAHPAINNLIGNNKDGMLQKYGQIALVDHNTKAKLSLADLQKADSDMQRRVVDAMTHLMGTQWVFPGSVVAVVSKPYGTIAPPKTSNAAATLHTSKPAVVESILRAAMVLMQISPDSPSNPGADPDNGYSFKRVGGVRVILSGVKFSGQGGFSTGRFEALPDKPKFRDLSLEEFEEHVKTIVQGIQRGVY
jgi:hypothetical protein